MRSANPKSIEALRWAATEENPNKAAAARTQSFEDHNHQLCLALALLCKESVLETMKHTYDSTNKERQRVRTQYLLQPKCSYAIAQTTETVETLGVRRDRIRTEIRESAGRRHQDRRHPRTGIAVSTEPLPLELTHLEELRTGQDDALRQLSGTGGRCRNRTPSDGPVGARQGQEGQRRAERQRRRQER